MSPCRQLSKNSAWDTRVAHRDRGQRGAQARGRMELSCCEENSGFILELKLDQEQHKTN